jgi:hypothetical protein
MGRIAALSLCAMLAGGGAALAEGAFDLVFRSGTLDGLPEGTQLRYEGEATSVAASDQDWQRFVVVLGPEDRALVEGRAAEGEEPGRSLGEYPATVGNPVAMLFLQRTVNSISEATGGSPFYIRNRIREALAGPGEVEEVAVPWEGGTIPATQVALRPFAGDAHRDQLGAFADLEIRVVVSEEVPGWYVSLDAEAPATASTEGFAASMALAGVQP